MYPREQLTGLAVYKGGLRRRIAQRREECRVATARLAQPVQWAERVVGFARKFLPIGLLPLGMMVQRVCFPRRKILGGMLRWLPWLTGAWKVTQATFGAPEAGGKKSR